MEIIKPFWYQTGLIKGTYSSWNDGNQNILDVAPTGAGKTYIMGFIAKEFNQRKQYVVIFAHRDVLISQISLSLATLGIYHNFLCNKKTINFSSTQHVEELGRSHYDENARVLVASVGTFNRRNTTSWENLVGCWMMDEAHHLLAKNQWGRCVEKLENAYGVGVTATPIRLDRKGLGRHADGVFDDLILGPTLGDLIAEGKLSPYRIVSTPLSKDVRRQMNHVPVVGNEYEKTETKKITSSPVVTGDVVGTYKKFAMGLRGITFGQDIDHCEKLADAYNENGVPAIALSSKTSQGDRWDALKKFKSGEILQLVNHDLFAEGFDLPACYTASFVNPTKSYGRYTQQFGRPLRTFEGKYYAWIFDHVGNVEEHWLPDDGLDWTLDRQEKRKRGSNTASTQKLTTCTNPDCLSDYALPASHCPWCGTPYAIASRKPLKHVDGELVELTDAELNQLRGKAKNVYRDPKLYQQMIERSHSNRVVVAGMVGTHIARQKAHEKLNKKIRDWHSKMVLTGLTPEQARQQFTEIYHCDMYTAPTLEKKKAEELTNRIEL